MPKPAAPDLAHGNSEPHRHSGHRNFSLRTLTSAGRKREDRNEESV